MQFDVAIIGGGVLGISAAYHLSRRGISVIVLEREASFGVHASGKNAGMIRQLYRHPKLTEWAARSIASWPDALREKAYRQTGSFVAGREVPGHHPEIFEQRRIRIEGAPPDSEVDGVYSATDGLIDPHSYLSELYNLVDRRVCRFAFSTEVAGLEQDGGGWVVRTGGDESYRSRKVINAAGAWINELLSPGLSSSKQPVHPYSRHLFMIHGWPDRFRPCRDTGFFWDEINNWYLREWDAATRLVSVCDETPADPQTYVPDPAIGRNVAAKLLTALPEVAENLSIGRSWHCFRTYTADRLPIVGPDSHLEGLFWLAAFGGFGMSTSFAAAEDAAAFIAGEPVELEAAFLPRI